MYEQIWVGITDTDRLTRYYAMLADKLRLRHQILSVLLAAIACGAAVPLLTRLPDWLAALMFLLVALATLWLLKADYSAKAAAAALFATQYGRLAVQWRQLWYGQPSQDQINELWNQYHQIASGLDIPIDHKLNQKAMEQADALLPSEFAGSDHPQRRAPAPATHP